MLTRHSIYATIALPMDNIRLNVTMTRETHRTLKMLAVRLDTTMQKLILDLITQRLQTSK